MPDTTASSILPPRSITRSYSHSAAFTASCSSNRTATTTKTRCRQLSVVDRLLLFVLVLLLLPDTVPSLTLTLPTVSLSLSLSTNARYHWSRRSHCFISASRRASGMSTSLSSHAAGAGAGAAVCEDQEAGAGTSSFKDAVVDDTHVNVHPAPLYITIAPPCAGKTTWLRTASRSHIPALAQGSMNTSTNTNTTQPVTTATAAASGTPIQDVCIDDQEGVYVPVDTALFLNSSLISNNDDTKNNETNSKGCETWFGQTVQQRIAAPEQAELVAILQRCAGLLSAEQFAARIHILYSKNNSNNNNNSRRNSRDNDQDMVAQALIQAVAKAAAGAAAKSSNSNSNIVNDNGNGKAQSLVMPPTTDLFVLQSLFMVDPNRNNTTGTTPSTGAGAGGTGIERALCALRAVDIAVPVAWGNTNTKPTDYKAALLLAAQQRRPVHFVVYHANSTTDKRSNNDVDLGMFEDGCWDLTVPSWHDLLERSVYRLLQTGRYVPASVIWDMHGRTQQMMQRVADHCRRDHNMVESVQQAKKSGDNSSAIDSTTGNTGTGSRQRLGKLELDRGLARFCGFDMNEHGLVSEGYRVPAAKQPRGDNYSSDNNIQGNSSQRHQRPGYGPPRRAPPERPWDRQNRARPEPRGPPPPNPYHQGPPDSR